VKDFYDVGPLSPYSRQTGKMKLSTRVQYGVRALLVLASQDESVPFSLSEISRREDISLAYLGQIFNRLRRKGLVESVRGPGGGFKLARKPEKITIGEIIRALENVTLVECIRDVRKCSRSHICSARSLWEKVGNTLDLALEGITLADISKGEREKENNNLCPGN